MMALPYRPSLSQSRTAPRNRELRIQGQRVVKRTPIEAILFDYGGVLGGPGITVDELARILDSPLNGIKRAWNRLIPEYQRGLYNSSEQNFWDDFCERANQPELSLYKSSNPWLAIDGMLRYEASEDLVARIKTANPSVKLGILSNTIPPHARHNWHKRRFTDFEPNVFLSCELMARKGDGDGRIYRMVAKVLDVPTEACLLVDDNPRYVAEAKRAGLRAIRFSRNTKSKVPYAFGINV
jgi:FMN phosphatase YigB (HAD superfamily)